MGCPFPPPTFPFYQINFNFMGPPCFSCSSPIRLRLRFPYFPTFCLFLADNSCLIYLLHVIPHFTWVCLCLYRIIYLCLCLICIYIIYLCHCPANLITPPSTPSRPSHPFPASLNTNLIRCIIDINSVNQINTN